MRVLVMATCLVLPGTFAMACPVVGDLNTGIRFTVDGVDSEQFRRIGPSMIESIFTTADGVASRSLLAQGIYLVELGDLVDGEPDLSTRTTYAFPDRAENLALPVPNGEVTYNITVNNNGDFTPEQHFYTFGESHLINFGACEYEMIPIEIRYDQPDSDTVDLLYYMPALELSYYAGTDYPDGSDRYIYTNIEVVQ